MNHFEMLPLEAFQPRPGGGMRLFGSKGNSTPPPDPALIAAQVKSMGIQDDLLQKSMALFESELLPIQREALQGTLEAAKMGASATMSAAASAAAPLMQQAATADKLANKAIELQDYQQGQMAKNDQRYWDVQVPMEDELIAQVKERESQKYKDQVTGRAAADVQQGFSSARAQTMRDAARMGLDPSSGAFGTGMARLATDQALGMASAKNNTRMALDNADMANKFQLYGGMKGMAGLGQTSASLATGAINAGTGAVNAGTNAASVGMRSAGGGSGSGASYRDVFSGANSIMSGYSGMAGMAGNMGSNATNMWNAQANAYNNGQGGDSLGGMLGGLGGLAAGAAKLAPILMGGSDRRLKQDIVAVGTHEPTGLTLYEFTYRDSPGTRWRGVMADEVAKVNPEAVVRMPNGFDAVNYGLLGLEMVEV